MAIYNTREPGQHGPPRPAAKLLGAQLRSDDPTQIAAAAQRIREALDTCGGNRTHAAERLGVSWRALVGWLREIPALQDLRNPARVA